MKKILYTLLAGAMALSSCSKSNDIPTAPQSDATTFTIAVDGAATRATSSITPARYVMEVWSEDGMTAENVFNNAGTPTNHIEINTGNTFTVTLDKTKAYTCLFWADDNSTFDAASLKAISLMSGKEMAEAYHAKVAVAKGKNPAVAVTLKRAVAKITLIETATVKTADNIALRLSNIYQSFSVQDAQATGAAAEWTKTIQPLATTGTIATFYFFAKTDKELSDLKFTYATGAEKTVSNIPVQQNYATNIKGEYSNIGLFTFTVTADDEWSAPDNVVDFDPKVYKVGDLYPNTTAPIGVVYYVDETDPTYNSADKTSTKGKIVGLTETSGIQWCSRSDVYVDVDSDTDGAANTALIFALGDYSASTYPVFGWVQNLNVTAPTGIKWYLPAVLELQNDIYPKLSILNASLNGISGANQFSAASLYWSSTAGSGTAGVMTVIISAGTAHNTYKTNTSGIIRALSVF